MECLSEERLHKFRIIIEQAKPNIAIVGHLDPDSIACMKAFMKICALFKKNYKLFYFGGWNNPQNNYLKNAFTLSDDFSELKVFDKLPDEEKKQYDIVLLDSSSLDDRRLEGIKINPIIIIDHHPTKNQLIESEKTFFWINSYGAAATMVSELYLQMGLSFENEPELATLIAVAIDTDTRNMSAKSTTQSDVNIFLAVWPYIKQDVRRDSRNVVKDTIYYAFEDKARDKRELQNNTALFFLGYIDADKADYLSFLSDQFSEYEDMKTVFVVAIGNDGFVYVKARSRDNTIDLDKEMKDRFGEKNAGARFGAGAAKIPMDFWIPSDNSKDEHLTYIEKRMRDAIFKDSSE
ncbi:DHH family phosphoesterase [Patescibacteria group bacterium]|nr:DHH family phosphoesterase [Patescibacteria group bacterium]